MIPVLSLVDAENPRPLTLPGSECEEPVALWPGEAVRYSRVRSVSFRLTRTQVKMPRGRVQESTWIVCRVRRMSTIVNKLKIGNNQEPA